MARQRVKARAGQPRRMQVIFPGELVVLVDRFAAQLSKERPFGPKATRTDALRTLVIEALTARGVIRTEEG